MAWFAVGQVPPCKRAKGSGFSCLGDRIKLYLIVCLALSLACHLALFLLPVGRLPPPNQTMADTLTVRLMPAQKIIAPPPITASPPPVSIPTPPPLPAVPAPVGLPAYFESHELTERPQALHDINTDVPLPPGEPMVVDAVFVLLINADGQVDQVLVDQSGLPDDVEQVLRQRFLALPFKPGQIDGQPVPCRVRIRLRFEAD